MGSIFQNPLDGAFSSDGLNDNLEGKPRGLFPALDNQLNKLNPVKAMGLCGSKAPKTPDPIVTAQAQADANIKVAQAQTALNRFDVSQPGGSTNWTQDENGLYTQSTNLSPGQQQIYDFNQGNQSNLAEGQGIFQNKAYDVLKDPVPVAPGQEDAAAYRRAIDEKLYDPTGDVSNAFQNLNAAQAGQATAQGAFNNTIASGGLNYTDLGPAPTANEATRQLVADSLYNQSISRLDPRFAQAQNDIQTQLAAQGITQGSAAYDREVANFGRDRNDAYTSASNTANSQSIAAMQQLFGMELAGRQQGVSETNYLRANPGNEALLATQLAGANTETASDLLGTQIARESAVPGIAQANFGLDSAAYGSSLQGRNQVMNELLNVYGMNNGSIAGGGTGSGAAAGGGNVGGSGAGAVIGQTPVADAIYNSYQGDLNAYNTKVASDNNTKSGIAAIGAAAITAY